MLFTVDKWTPALSLLVSRRRNQPGATDNPGLRVCFVRSRWLGCLCHPLPLTSTLHSLLLFIHYLCQSWRYCTSCLSRLVFIFWSVFFSPHTFIFCSLPPPLRAKALRIANSPFPHLSLVCRRVERHPRKSNSESCQFHGPTGGPTISSKKAPCHPSSHVRNFAPMFPSIKRSPQSLSVFFFCRGSTFLPSLPPSY